MPEFATPRPLIHAKDDAGIATSRVVTTVFDEVLEAIHEGRLRPGERINDTMLASTFGVSRTPVREALQRLREIGVIEASASRFTRVAVVSPRQTAEAMIVWGALYSALLDEVVPIADAAVVAAMTEDHEAFHAAVERLEMQNVATTNFAFFSRLTAISTNEALRRAITSVVHLIRLGSLHLPDYVDFAALDRAQATLLEAVHTHDVALAQSALAVIRAIRIPIEPV